MSAHHPSVKTIKLQIPQLVRRFAMAACIVAMGWSSCASVTPTPESERVVHGLSVRQMELAGITYLEVVPEGVSFEARLPTIVSIHGRGDGPELPRGRFLDIPEDVRLILPKAEAPLGDGFTWLPVSAAKGESRKLVRSLRDTAARLAAFLDELPGAHPTAGEPIVTGFSQGGMLTFTLATHHPEVLGAAFPVAGWLPPSLIPDAPATGRLPLLRAMHGTDDPVLLSRRTRRTVNQLRDHGFSIMYREFPAVGHEMNGEMRGVLRTWIRAAVRERIDTGRRPSSLSS